MKKEKLIAFMFDQLENEGAFSRNKSKEFVHYSKKQQKRGLQFYDFIRKNIYPKELSEQVKQLAEEYVNSCQDTFYCEFKVYYHQGFLDGINFASK